MVIFSVIMSHKDWSAFLFFANASCMVSEFVFTNYALYKLLAIARYLKIN